jgi:hypothetical protein
MSLTLKSLLGSLRVKVTVAISSLLMLLMSMLTAMVGAVVSMVNVNGAVVPPDGVLAV